MTNSKYEELRAKIGSIGVELAFWRAESAAHKRWEKHHSQINRIATQIETAAGKLSAVLEAAAVADTVMEEARNIERVVVDLHAVWDFFRSKLVPRGIADLAAHLIVADEFAWACYRPALESIDPLQREPPLTFFQSDTSPFALPRNHAYASAGSERLRSADAIAMLKSLPIAIIAVPWFQGRHLPDLLIVAHEVGHHVEDLGLTADLLAAVEHVPHAAAWKCWASEVFADVFATVACGPAFTTALTDFLATSRATIATEMRMTGDYPTAYLRILLSIAVVKQLGFTTEAEALHDRWTQAYPTHAMRDWEADCAIVAKAILERSYRGRKLSALLTFDGENQKRAIKAATQALDAQIVTAAPDVRELVAAAALAFARDPVRFHEKAGDRTAQDRIVEQIVSSQASGTRSGAAGNGPHVVADTKPRDEAGGLTLFDTLLNLA